MGWSDGSFINHLHLLRLLVLDDHCSGRLTVFILDDGVLFDSSTDFNFQVFNLALFEGRPNLVEVIDNLFGIWVGGDLIFVDDSLLS